jgi:hypothetical protein
MSVIRGSEEKEVLLLLAAGTGSRPGHLIQTPVSLHRLIA